MKKVLRKIGKGTLYILSLFSVVLLMGLHEDTPAVIVLLAFLIMIMLTSASFIVLTKDYRNYKDPGERLGEILKDYLESKDEDNDTSLLLIEVDDKGTRVYTHGDLTRVGIVMKLAKNRKDSALGSFSNLYDSINKFIDNK